MEVDFSKQIKSREVSPEDTKIISEQSWAKEKNAGKKLNKPFRTSGGPKKFSVYVKNEKGNVVKVNFGDPNMEIKRDDPARRKSFRARHNCDNPGPKTKAKYWSCKMWSQKKEEALKDAKRLGLQGYHEHKAKDGSSLFMAGPNHESFIKKHKELTNQKNERNN